MRYSNLFVQTRFSKKIIHSGVFTIKTERPFISYLDLARVCGFHMQGIQGEAVVGLLRNLNNAAD